jgi:hypothetical protein
MQSSKYGSLILIETCFDIIIPRNRYKYNGRSNVYYICHIYNMGYIHCICYVVYVLYAL